MQAQFVKIKSALLASIEDGDMKPGDKVPSENQLASQYTVSRMTARRALTDLVDEGILLRTQGVGTFVADHRPMSSMLTIRSINEEVSHRGHEYRCEVQHQDRAVADERTGSWLGIPVGAELLHIRIVHFENGLPVQLEQRWVNPHWAPEFLAQDFEKQTANQYLSKIAPLTEADHVVEAIAAEQDIADLLDIESLAPCLKISRRTFSAKGIVSFAVLIHPGNRYRLGGHLDF